MTGVAPSWSGLAFAAIPVAVAIVLIAMLRLRQVRPMLFSLTRMTLQLVLLGYVLEWLFSVNSPIWVGFVATIMLLASAHTVGARMNRGVWALRLEAFIVLGIHLSLVMAISLRLALHPNPWFAPRVVIPLLGMILGNSLTAVALAAERFESELKSDRDRVELRLALGASSLQAAMPALRAAARAALTPIINNMMIAGIVAIPGMTTGQLLAGANVADAIRYQILVYLGIAATVTLSTMTLLFVRLRHYFTPYAQLRLSAITTTDPA